MGRGKNTFSLAAGFNITGQQPIDSRLVVDNVADLYLADTWSGVGLYNGLVVAIKSTGSLFVLKDRDNYTETSSWVAVGADLSSDIASLDGRIDDLETFETAVNKKLDIADNSALEFDSNGALKVKIAENTENLINGLELDSNGALKVATYNLVAKTEANNGYAATYEFKVNGDTVTTINIPKDQFLQNAEFVASLSVDDATTYGLESGKPYLKFTWQLDTDSTLEGDQKVTFVPVSDLVDTYTAGEYITITNNVVDVNYTKIALHLSDTWKLADQFSAIAANTAAIGDSSKGLIADVAGVAANLDTLGTTVETLSTNVAAKFEANDKQLRTINTEITGIKATLDDCKVRGVDTTDAYGISLSLVDPNSEDDDTTATHVKVNVDLDTLAAAVIAKHDVPAPIAENIAVSAFGTTYTEDTNVQAVLESLDSRIRAAVSGGVTSVVNGFGINVNATDANNPTVSVKTSDLVVAGSALTVTDNKIDICWSEL